MGETVILEVPDGLAKRAQEIAVQSHRSVNDMLAEWLDRTVAEPPIESLSDGQILALCDLQMDSAEQMDLSGLLGRHREGALRSAEYRRLDELMQVYRQGLVRKARASKVAVERGLRPPLEYEG